MISQLLKGLTINHCYYGTAIPVSLFWCRRFSLSPFWFSSYCSVAVLVCRRFDHRPSGVPEVMILSCRDVHFIGIKDLSSLTVCLNLLICELAFTYVCIASCNLSVYTSVMCKIKGLLICLLTYLLNYLLTYLNRQNQMVTTTRPRQIETDCRYCAFCHVTATAEGWAFAANPRICYGHGAFMHSD